MMILLISGTIVFLAVALVLAPFVFGEGGQLSPAAATDSTAELEGLQKAILDRFLEEERAFKNSEISEKIWQQRQALHGNRYIDTSRRLDFLRKKQGGV